MLHSPPLLTFINTTNAYQTLDMTTAPRLVDSKWTAVHARPPAGPGDARPTAADIIKDEGLAGRWTDKVILITGASNGIGVETARALYATGAHLFLPVRDMKKGESVVQDIVSKAEAGAQGKGKIELLQLDMASLESVRACAAAFLSKSKQLNVLICNAGVMACPESRTVDGFETQFGVDHLAHFLLFQLLKDALLSSSTPQFASRVVCVSSSAHLMSPVLFDDYDQKKQGYDKWRGYGQAKTANIHMANEIERRYGARGLHALSVMPGGIMTGLQVHVSKEELDSWAANPTIQSMIMSVEQGAATTVWAATAAAWEGKGGRYVENCQEAVPTSPEMYGMGGHAKWTYDAEAAQRLWKESLPMVGLPSEE